MRGRLAPAATLPLCMYLAVLLALVTCLALPLLPGAVSLEDRLAAFPRVGPGLVADAEVLFSDEQVPFILAQADEDVPYLLGMVQAHLRLGQMEFYRLISQARLSEVAGPLTRDLDQSLRILDLDRAVPAMEAGLPAATRAWIERFVTGVNHYREQTRRPYELRALGFPNEPWTVRDVLTLGRLLSVDVNWLRWYGLLGIRNEPAYPAFLDRLQGRAGAALPSFGSETPTPVESLVRIARPGSNSVVVAPERSASGGALIANDPHLGLQQPNLWLLAGYRSPSGAAVGLMYPGIPVVLIGRNEDIAWGGTNMLSTSSTLYDVSGLPPEAFTDRSEVVKTRIWADREFTARDTTFGPVITDAPLLQNLGLPTCSLKWRGHEASDEATAMLRVNRAGSWAEFRQAFATYGVSGQNLLYADTSGNIGQLLALEFIPAAGRTVSKLPADPADPANLWTEAIRSTELPAVLNPEAGYLVSSNNTPVRLDPAIGLFGNANDRVRRYSELIEAGGKLTVADLMRMQRDTASLSSRDAAQAMARKLGNHPLAATLRDWDGFYRADLRGALAYQLVVDGLLSLTYAAEYGGRIAGYLRTSAVTHELLREDLETRKIPVPHLEAAAEVALERLSEDLVWGDLHRLRVAHPLGAIPVLGRRFGYGSFPVAGSSTTIWKSAHAISWKKHATTFGQNSRHVSDLSDPDENYFVLFGGQDGWFGSENLLDQVNLWREGKYLKVPLREQSVREAFPHRIPVTRGAGKGDPR